MDTEYAQYLLKKTRDDYNLIADDFSRTRNKPWEELNFLKRYVKTDERVLDLGCGNGRIFELLKDKQVDYYGIDVSEKLIDIAKKNYPKAKFIVGDALNLPFSNSFFDAVFSIAVIHQIPSNELRSVFLKEAKRVLKPNGRMILTVWKFHQLDQYYLLFKYTILRLILKSKLDWKDILEPWANKTERYYHWFSKKELEILLEDSGFKAEEIGIIKNKKGNRQNIYLVARKPL